MATTYKIHPSIGVARIGNSPDDFFIGPEIPGKMPDPTGGFKDNQCRIKRQAARFRIFAHHDDGTAVEITNSEAEINWTVHLVNKKAAHPDRNNTESPADLTIDPGNRTTNGPNQRKIFDTGVIKFSGAPVTKVPLGEIRTDGQNHLLVLGGFGNSGSPTGAALDGYFWASDDWYDDVSDGPVTATIKLRADNSTPAVVGAWVIVGPPKFAPHQESVITLYDRILQAMVDGGIVAAPNATSYTKDIYPILQRARDTAWVEQTFGAHTWNDPVTTPAVRTAIFNKLKAPGGGGGNMPMINNSGTNDDRLTAIQYQHMQNWKDNINYINDWTGVPGPNANITPDGLDRASLEACVGGAFYPGIEAGGLPAARPIIETGNYSEAFRLNHSVVEPGGITYEMALPWQNDFFQCANNWWPVPRPNYVIRQGMTNQAFLGGMVSSATEMVSKWSKLGFILRNGVQHTELNRCDISSIHLLTPALNFQDVPQGPMGMVRELALSITFEVISTGGPVTLQYAMGGAPNHPQLVAFNSSVTVGPTTGNNIAIARLWIIFRTGTAGSSIPPQTIIVQDSAGTQSWTIIVTGNTVARKTAAVAMVLDRSGSMSEDRGDGLSKHVSLQQAASIFVDVMLEGDGAGVVRFNENAQVLQSILSLGTGGLSDLNRSATKDILNGNGLDPSGSTSIGDGIFEGRGILNATATPFDVKSLVVLTDGVENSSRYIADVASEINEYTYSIGLGQPANISVPALQTISGNNGGYLLVTGAITGDNRFMLQKYFLQILAGVSNAEVVLDPTGVLTGGQLLRIPFNLTSADAGVDVILLTPNTKIVDFRIQTPSGQIIEPWLAMSKPGMRFVLSNGVSYYRIALPYEFMNDRFDNAGTWHALLTIGYPRLQRSDTKTGLDESIRKFKSSVLRSTTRDRGPWAAYSTIMTEELAGIEHSPVASYSEKAAAARYSAPYSIIIHAYSNLSLHAYTGQNSFEPGSVVKVHASLTQSGIPLNNKPHVWIEIKHPNGFSSTVVMEEKENEFTANFQTTIPGVYQFRIRANGVTQSNESFTREKTLTAAVWRGGDKVVDPKTGTGKSNDDDPICKLLQCLLKKNGVLSPEIEKRLESYGINIARARECISKLCNDK